MSLKITLGDAQCYSSLRTAKAISYRPKFVRTSPSPRKSSPCTDLTVKGTNIFPSAQRFVATAKAETNVPLKKRKKKKRIKKTKKEEEEPYSQFEYKIIQPLKPLRYNFLNQMRPKTAEPVHSELQDISRINPPIDDHSSHIKSIKASFHLNNATEFNKTSGEKVFSRVAKRIDMEMRVVKLMIEESRPKTAHPKVAVFRKAVKKEKVKAKEDSNENPTEENAAQEKVEGFKSQTASELYNLTKNLFD
eukprot:TRINITY_DN6897_c0_g1_i1.p1 TRINITY_DN6897_c0_g1~~TRINITY_DN6897_c0_g1_i1.p1  ORF type:complete len:248 (+),score=43.33 TRINITY_DN6897_c0_g1_i1:256-999(+)